METNSVLIFIVVSFSVLFLSALISMMCANRSLLKSADKRLEKANEMVLHLANSADNLAKSMADMKDITCNIKATYEKQLTEIQRSREDITVSYNKLLTRYTILEEKIFNEYDSMQRSSFNAIKEMATRPAQSTITNNNLEKV